MVSVLSKFCACLFCFCPDKNCYGRHNRQTQIIYEKIKPKDDYIGPEEV